MKNLEIKYFAENGSMGDTSADDCDAFRAWAKAALEAEYPEACIEVSAEISSVECFVKGAEGREKEEEIVDFCSRLWDRCPWDF